MIPPHRVISFFSNATISTLFHPHQEIKNEHRAECMYFFITIACEFLCRGTLLKRAAGESHQPQPRQGVGVGGAASAATRGPSHLPASGFCPNCPRGVGQAPPDLPGKQPAPRPPRQAATAQGDGGSRPSVPHREQDEHGQEEPWTHQHTRLRPRTEHSGLQIRTGSHRVEGAGQEVAGRATPSTLHTRTPRSREGS